MVETENRKKEENDKNGWGVAAYYSPSEEVKGASLTVNSVTRNQQYQSKLSAIGFYSGPIDGNMSSSMTRKAVTNFQKMYGIVPADGSASATVLNKIDSVVSTYNSIKQSTGLVSLASEDNLNLDNIQISNFARICAFLKEGMGLTKAQMSGVLGNMFVESGFSSDNAQESAGYTSKHDYSYSFSTTDSVGYGLLQWTVPIRKEGLQKEASNMGLDVSDLNAQIMFFQKEMTRDYYSGWKKILLSDDVHEVSDIFHDKIERPEKEDYNTRRMYSDIIYNFLNGI